LLTNPAQRRSSTNRSQPAFRLIIAIVNELGAKLNTRFTAVNSSLK
jgi:hypothetical protein